MALAVIDNFLQPEAFQMLRRFAIQQEYVVEEHDGIPYHGVGRDPGLVAPEKLAAVLGLPAITVSASFFRLGPAVEHQNSWIHVDNGMYGALAAVLYLNPPPLPGGYGTAFWTHRERGWAYLPNVADLERAGVLRAQPRRLDWSPYEATALPNEVRDVIESHLGACGEVQRERSAFYASLNEDGLHEDRWHLNGLVGMQPNRLIVYPTCLFHSRYPRALTGFGDTSETGRLIWGCFFSPA